MPDHALLWPDRRNDRLALAAVVTVAALARFYRLGLDSFWLDEAASWWFASRPLAEQWGEIPFYEPHPPLYYTLLWLWSRLFGEGEAALRSLSAVASILTVPVIYGIGRLAVAGRQGAWAGLLGALLAALYPTQIAFGQETRPYALLTLAVAILLLCLLWLLAHPQALDRPLAAIVRDRSTRARRVVAGAVLAAAASFWLHNTALILVSPLLLLAAAILLARARFSWQVVRNLLIAGAVIFLLWSPNIRWLLSGLSEISAGFWLQAPRWLDLAWGGDELLGSGGVAQEISWKAGLALLNLLLMVVGAAAVWRRGNPGAAALLLGAVVIPFGFAVGASYLITPVFMTRVLVWIEIPAAVLVAAGVLWLPTPFLRMSAAGVASGLLGVVLALGWGRQVKEPWNEVARIIAEESQANDLIIADTAYAQVPMLYYRVPERSPALWLPLPEAYPRPIGERGYPDGFFLRGKIDDATVDRIREAAVASRKIWYVTRGRTVYDWDQRVAKTLQSVHGPRRVRVQSGQEILLSEYSRNRASASSSPASLVPAASAAPIPAASGQ